jgi:hypothetical protein
LSLSATRIAWDNDRAISPAFSDTYLLRPNESVRLIGPPFISDRLSIYHRLNPREATGSSPEMILLQQQQDGRIKYLHNNIAGDDHIKPEPEETLRNLAPEISGLYVWQIQGDVSLLDQPLPGDCVILQGAGSEELLTGLAHAAGQRLHRGIAFTHNGPV